MPKVAWQTAATHTMTDGSAILRDPFLLKLMQFCLSIANGDEFHRALLLEAQHSINNNLNLTIVQNMTYRGRQGRVISEITFDLSDIY